MLCVNEYILLVDDFIFLNLSCYSNFAVNNCIVLFQVANKPVMTRTLLYSLILELYGGLTVEASIQSQICNI